MISHNIFDVKLARITLMIIALIWLGMSSAIAEPPTNDDFASATIATEPLPFVNTINTSEAITAEDDPYCSGQGPTVWYSFTPSENMRIQANSFGSDYDTTLSVYTGIRGNLLQIACNDDTAGLQSSVSFDAVAGQTYYFMAGAFGSGPGGNLVFTVQVAPPPLTIDLIIDPVGSFDRLGSATIRGTISCSSPTFVNLFGEVKQEAGRLFVRGAFGTYLECNGNTPWEVTINDQNGKFAGGPIKASARANAYDQNTGEFSQDSADAIVQLRGSGKP
ncbi:PPC domain-containing protein [Nitrosomonas communis]|uniref:Peptidase C-terminal archaeal/bacterial domain-containing protein n=1 Tax=Nitrosomonas communis TaxID=44574 RepID=A0A1I4V3G3_9PROT|nr:PPC domain-containing protein [Nitrosomonas communis]SFM95663.1 hypothetical protein SAMN05421863_107515 [Nitrosomonas communis]